MVKCLFRLFTGICLAFFTAHAQYGSVPGHGTMIIMEIQSDRILVAADSRKTMNGEHWDDECKIVPFMDRGFFVLFGNVALKDLKNGKMLFDANAVARKSVATLQGKGTIPIAKIAARWGEAMRVILSDRMAKTPSDFAKYDRKEALITGIFAAGIDRGFVVQKVQLFLTTPIKAVRTAMQTNPPSAPMFIYGSADAILASNEFYANHSARAIAAKSRMDQVADKADPGQGAAIEMEFVIQAAEDWDTHGTIGGDIDVLELPKTGHPVWLHVKESCRQK